MKRWLVQSGGISEIVNAADQWQAWDCLRDYATDQFGLATTAEPDENGDPFMVRTSLLMYRWGRDDDAREIQESAIENGWPDTTTEDRAAALSGR